MTGSIKKVLNIFDKVSKTKLLLLTILSLFSAIAETISISLVMPYINILMDPKKVTNFPIIGKITYEMSQNQVIVYSSIVLLLIFALKNIFITYMYYIQSKFVFNRQHSFLVSLLKNYLTKPYDYFFSHNVAEVQRNLNTSIYNVMQWVILPTISLICEIFIAILIFSLMVYVDFASTAIIALVLGGIVALIYKKQKKVLAYQGKSQQQASLEIVKWVNQSILGIKEVKVRENFEYYIEKMYKSGKKYTETAIYSTVINQIPRLMIEVVAILSLVTVVIVNVLLGKDLNSLISILVIFAAGAYRLMPSFNRILANLNLIRFHMASFNNIYSDLIEINNKTEINEKEINSINFENEIRVKNLYYRYKSSQDNVLENINIIIPKNKKIGIVGQSGQGKTTLLDLILGLLEPDSGEITVDGESITHYLKAWHSLIGYVPQNIYLLDDTILNNILLGHDDNSVDMRKIKAILKIVKLEKFVENIPDGVNTIIGDNGICLSGGQRQRIAIARALYNEPKILVMDEATSSLDSETENYISDTLNNLEENMTFIIVAHRLSTLKNCDIIYKIVNKTAIRVEFSELEEK